MRAWQLLALACVSACGGASTGDPTDAAPGNDSGDAAGLADAVTADALPTDAAASETLGDASADAAGGDAIGADDLLDAPTDGDAAAKDLQALCVEGLPNPLKFDPTAVGAGALATLDVHNCGTQGVCLTGVDLQLQSAFLGEYALQMKGFQTLCPGVDAQKGPSVTQPCCLAPDGHVSMDVYFTPESASTSAKTAQIWLMSNAGKTIVLLSGLATN